MLRKSFSNFLKKPKKQYYIANKSLSMGEILKSTYLKISFVLYLICLLSFLFSPFGVHASSGVVSSVAQIKSLSVMAHGDVVSVLGFSSIGDGGGGEFWWDSKSVEPENGGTVINSNTSKSGRWKRIYTGAIHVRWFGATGDGISDDSGTIEAALRAIASGGEIFFSAGTYLLKRPVKQLNISGDFIWRARNNAKFRAAKKFPNNKLIQLKSSRGLGNKIIFSGGYYDGTNIPKSVKRQANDILSLTDCDVIAIRDVTTIVNKPDSGFGSDSHIFVASVASATLEGNSISGAVDAGIYVSAPSSSPYGGGFVSISNNVIENCNTAVIVKRGFEQAILIGNSISDCVNGLVGGGEAKNKTGGMLGTVNNVIISDNIIRRTQGSIIVRLAKNFNVSNNIIYEIGKVGSRSANAISIQGASNGIIIGNIVNGVSDMSDKNKSYIGISLMPRNYDGKNYNSTNNIISNNVVSNLRTIGVEVNKYQDGNAWINNRGYGNAKENNIEIKGINSTVSNLDNP